MIQTAIVLFAAALLEVGGDALTRLGLQGKYGWLVAGALMLAVYGITVNQGRLDFGRLMGAYIAVFFLVSQVISFALFRTLPDFKSAIGGALIVSGGAILIL